MNSFLPGGITVFQKKLIFKLVVFPSLRFFKEKKKTQSFAWKIDKTMGLQSVDLKININQNEN